MILEYTNRVTGGPVMPTIACHMQLLRPGEQTLGTQRIQLAHRKDRPVRLLRLRAEQEK